MNVSSPEYPIINFPGESLHKLNETNNQHKLQDLPPVSAGIRSQNNIALLLSFLYAFMVSGESCNKVNYNAKGIRAEARLGREDLSLVRYTAEIAEFNTSTSSLQRFPRRVSVQVK